MKGVKFSEEQIIGILKEGEISKNVAELCRRVGITQTTLYRWQKKFGGMDVSEARRLRQLEDENRRLRHLVANLSLDNEALKGVLSKKW